MIFRISSVSEESSLLPEVLEETELVLLRLVPGEGTFCASDRRIAPYNKSCQSIGSYTVIHDLQDLFDYKTCQRPKVLSS